MVWLGFFFSLKPLLFPACPKKTTPTHPQKTQSQNKTKKHQKKNPEQKEITKDLKIVQQLGGRKKKKGQQPQEGRSSSIPFHNLLSHSLSTIQVGRTLRTFSPGARSQWVAFGRGMAEEPAAPPLMVPQPGHIWVSLSGTDGAGACPFGSG